MISIIFQSLGGLGLFLFGMKLMSEGLQKVAGKRIREILHMISNNRFIGCGVGAIVTSVIQSSSATTVMLVGFVDAGIITLTQAVGVTLGANIGTTVTAQLIAFSITSYALPAIAFGVLLKFFTYQKKWIYLGDFLLGFGLVFYGLATMKAGIGPLNQNESFLSFFTHFSGETLGGILLCVLAGTTLTMILQSSSATVGITMALASQGLLDFETSVAIILGDNIGTTITAELASIGTSINARRTARANTLFNFIGVIIIILFFPVFLRLVYFLTSSIMHFGPPDAVINGERHNISRYLANSHTMFNIINALIFLIFLPYLVKVATFFTSQKSGEQEDQDLHHVRYMDFRFIDTPSIALDQASAEIFRMGEAVQIMYSDVIDALKNLDMKGLSRWRKREYALDTLQKEITQFLIRVTQGSITQEESKEIRSKLRMVNNLERIGDAVQEIAEMIEKMFDGNWRLSDEGMNDYMEISNEVEGFIDLVLRGIRHMNPDIMEEAVRISSNINRMVDTMKLNHLIRLQKGVCGVDPGMIFVNILASFERIGSFCFNISQAVAGLK